MIEFPVYLVVVCAQANAGDGLAAGFATALIILLLGNVGVWGADKSAVFVVALVLECALWLGSDASGDIAGASCLQDAGACWGAHGAGDAGDGDVDFVAHARSVKGVAVVGGCRGAWAWADRWAWGDRWA